MIRTWNRSHFVFDRNSSGAPVTRFVRILAGHLHVAAERQRADAVLGVAAAEAEDRRVEAELKLQHADADALGGEKMAELVDEHEHAEHEAQTRAGWSMCLTLVEPQTFNSTPRAIARACSRAHRSTARTSPASPPRPARCASIVSLDDLGIAGNDRRPVEKQRDRDFVGGVQHDRQAALRSSARYARPRHGKRVGIGRFELEPSGAREIERRQRRRPALGIRERVLDRQPHVGDAELRDHRSVDQLDHRMHDRLRVDDDVDLIGAARRTASAPR